MKLVVLSCLLAAASASAIAAISPFAPLVYSAPYLAAAAPNYRGPLSLAPGQPADVLGADGRPLDTLDVNLDRAAHYTAKALEPYHVLKKRSAAFIAPISTYAVAHSPLITPASPLAYTAPLAAHLTAPLAAPLAPLAYTSYTSAPVVHVLKKRSAALIAPVARVVAPAPVITTAGAVAYSAPWAAPYAPPTFAAPLAPWYKK